MTNKINKNITLVNSISSLLLQIVAILCGFIIPKLTLDVFGSEVNGLVLSLTQFLSYISLMEGGVTGVITASLYKPIADNDEKKISAIINTAKKFYKQVGIIFIVYSLFIAIIYPIIFNTNFSYTYIFALTLILSLTLFIKYMFSLSLKTLLITNKKVYIVSFVEIIILILNVILFYIVIKIYPNIHILKLITGLLYIIQPIIFNKVTKKYFNIDKNEKPNNQLLKSRWDGFAINMAAFIHNGTDIVILTIYRNLKEVSVYSIYKLVTTGLKKLIVSISAGITPTMGNIYSSGNKEQLKKKFELHEFIMFILVFFFFTIGSLLITPFVLLYTKNINDINYNEPIFGYLIMLAEAIYCLREPYVSLSYSANKFNDIKKASYFETFINIIVSIVLVIKYGLIGVAIGTLLAMTYRTLFHVHYFKNNVVNRSPKIFYKKLILFSLTTVIGITICIMVFPLNNLTLTNWIISAIIYSIIFGLLYLLLSLIFYKNDLLYFKNKFFKQKKYQ